MNLDKKSLYENIMIDINFPFLKFILYLKFKQSK